MSSNDTTETITADEMNQLLNEEVTLTIPTTVYGFVTIMGGLELMSELAADHDVVEALELLALKAAIEFENPEVESKFQLVSEYVDSDSVTGKTESVRTVLAEDYTVGVDVGE